MRIFQKGFNFSQDGPGNRLVIHLQGCNFKCPWCSNPEGMEIQGRKCEEVSVKELFDYIVHTSLLFFDGGGVTFTGGECTVQHNELLSLLKMLHEEGINTAVETNASDPRLCELLPYIDYLIADIKHTDDEIHKKYTGVSNKTVIKNISSVLLQGRQLHLRIPLINGFNTDPKPFFDFFCAYPTENAVLEILPYHEYGKSKWTEEYTVKNGFVNEKTLNYFTSEIGKSGITIIST
ncbi:MAG: radical SAM protein [Clostridia bacterium]|nr:radical SAM protein [Clostridia bacterium]